MRRAITLVCLATSMILGCERGSVDAPTAAAALQQPGAARVQVLGNGRFTVGESAKVLDEPELKSALRLEATERAATSRKVLVLLRDGLDVNAKGFGAGLVLNAAAEAGFDEAVAIDRYSPETSPESWVRLPDVDLRERRIRLANEARDTTR